MHGGAKFYRGSPSAARSYVEADRTRVDDYYLTEGTGLATHYTATRTPTGEVALEVAGQLDGETYEAWVAGYDVTTGAPTGVTTGVTTGAPKGRLRTDDRALRFVEVVVNGPKTWSLAAALHPAIAAAYDTAQDHAATEIITWLTAHATTRIGPRGRQVQVPVEALEAAVVRHHTSRAGDPHRHLHLQINARVRAAGAWRGLHSVGVVDSLQAINGIGHAAIACDPHFRAALASHGYTLDPASGEITQLAPYTGAFSARAAQITRNIDTFEAQWRTEHPGVEPGPGLRRAWDRRAWAHDRPDKVVPTDGGALRRRWVEELTNLGYTPPWLTSPTTPATMSGASAGRVDRDAVADLALSRLGTRRSAWNGADIRGEVETILTTLDLITPPAVRRELAEDLTARTLTACRPLLTRDDVPEHVRAWTSPTVLAVEADLTTRLAARAQDPAAAAEPDPIGARVGGRSLDDAQRRVVAALTGTSPLIVIEGAAGAGKTTALAAARDLLEHDGTTTGTGTRFVVVTPTRKAAQVVAEETGAWAYTAAWLIHAHGFRHDDDGHHTRLPLPPGHPPRLRVDAHARLHPGDLLVVDEAGMLDQDTAHALLTIADETGARLAFLGDRHQLPAVGRGGALDHAHRWTPPPSRVELDTVHRFTDPAYATLTLAMRTGTDPGAVFDALHARGEIRIHPSDVERHHALTTLAAQSGTTVIADTRAQVTALNASIRDHHHTSGSGGGGRTAAADERSSPTMTTDAGETIGVGDRVATRRNDRDLDVANRERWSVTTINHDNGSLTLTSRGNQRGLPIRQRTVPADYARTHLELAYATTVHGTQGDTVDTTHFVLGETTGAAAAYVAMTRGRHHNTAHLVATDIADARGQWIATFSRDRADLGPAHAATRAADDIDRHGPQPPPRPPERPAERPAASPPQRPRPAPTPPPREPNRSPGISR